MPVVSFVAGEASGDIHAGRLVSALRALLPDLSVWAVGGEELRKAGAEILFSSDAISGMGLWEAVGRLPALARARRLILERFDRSPPDLFVPVDFGGLNLTLARRASKRGIPVAYYIPPKVWAWGGRRAEAVRRTVAEVLVILPFEEGFWRERGVEATYVGSPVLDHLNARAFDPEGDVVGLLPGSRRGEVSRIWPLLLDAAAILGRGRELRFLVPRAPGLPAELLKAGARGRGLRLEILEGRSQEVMERSRVCLVASGTATLECAVVGTPMVVVYRVSPLTYGLGRLLVSAPYISLPNLIVGRGAVPELIQTRPEAVAREAQALLEEGTPRQRMLEDLAEVRRRLGPPGASVRAAERIAERLRRRARA